MGGAGGGGGGGAVDPYDLVAALNAQVIESNLSFLRFLPVA